MQVAMHDKSYLLKKVQRNGNVATTIVFGGKTMYTMKAAAKYLNLDYQTFYRAVRMYYLIPEPTHQYGKSLRKYYTKSEVEKFGKVLDQYHTERAK